MSHSPLGDEGMADRLVARSKTSRPDGPMTWTLYVSDQLVRAAEDWSRPVRFRFDRNDDGTVEMWMRHVEPEADGT